MYVGYTDDMKSRIKEHNSGLVKATKERRPLKIVYLEGYLSKFDAQQRERNLKLFSNAYKVLKTRIRKSIHEA